MRLKKLRLQRLTAKLKKEILGMRYGLVFRLTVPMDLMIPSVTGGAL